MSTYGLHDNPVFCNSFSHERLYHTREKELPAPKWQTPCGRLWLCSACKTRWERCNWPKKCDQLPAAKKGGAA